ncbi:MAG: hypothetical protein ACE5HB_07055 [Terriglobia bacterium]
MAPPAADHNSVCTWDLYLQAVERQAWLECAPANPRGADLEAFLARRFDGRV